MYAASQRVIPVAPLLVISAVVALLALAFAPAQAIHGAGHRTVTQHDGNPTCGELIPGAIEVLRINNAPTNKTYGAADGATFGFEVTIQNATSTSFDFTGATLPVAGVFVKGGPQGVLYAYDPAATADTGLNAGINPNSGKLYGISHVSFCVLPVLSISKTANTAWDQDYEWSIEKTVDPETAGPVNPGDSVLVEWSIEVTKSLGAESNHKVYGNITIHNPWPVAATGLSVTDALDDGTTATVNCGGATSVAAGATLVCTYEAFPLDKSAELNTAKVTTAGGPAGGTATAAVVWSPTPTNVTNDCAVITDDQFPGGHPFGSDPICDSDLTSYQQTITVPSTHECPGTFRVDNTAVVTPVDGGDPDDSTATVEIDVECPLVGEGCTPGFWRQSQHFAHWTGYATGHVYNEVFGVSNSLNDNLTLLDAVWTGGGGERALLRHSVAALLNAASGDVNFAYTEAEVIDIVQSAYGPGGLTFNQAASLLAAANEEGCPL